MIDKLAAQDIIIHHLDMGGGLGVTYNDEASIDLTTFGEAIYSRFKNRKLKLIIEPGRFLVANGGILLTTVETLKPGETKNFAVVDAAMNDLIRPALYQAHHSIIPVKQSSDTAAVKTWDIVGPVCETADFLAKDRDLPLVEGDLLAILSCGAYASVLASNYNTRNRAPEVLIKGDKIHVVRKRESISHQLLLESLAK
jgi:diaminopimelate decarboxylase